MDADEKRNAIARIPPNGAPLAREGHAPEVAKNLAAALADNTQRAYRADWECWSTWCATAGKSSMPADAETVAEYASALMSAGRKISTVRRHLATISKAHRLQRHANPTASELVANVLRGASRRFGARAQQKAALSAEQVRQMAATCNPRDAALILLGFAGAFRRSELVGLTWGDVQFCDDGVLVTVRKSKTDQEGQGFVKAIAHAGDCGNPAPHADFRCAVCALAWWRSIWCQRGAMSAPTPSALVFAISAMTATTILKTAAERVGIDPSVVSGHSLRAGHVTEAYAQGVPEAAIQQMTGHRSSDMLRRYRRERNPFAATSSNVLGGRKGK